MRHVDPRVKLVWLIGAAVGIFSFSDWYIQLGILLVLGSALIIRHGMVKFNLRPLRILLFFLPFTFIIHILFGSHLLATIFADKPRDSWQVLFWQPLGFTLRIGNIIILMTLATQWLKALEVLDAFYHFLKPLRKIGLPVDDLFQVIFIAVRFIPLMREEYQRLDESWRIFINRRPTSLAAKVERLRMILIPLMIVSFRRAEVLAEAMTVRGYDPKAERSYVGQLRWRAVDWVGLAVGLGALVLVVVIV
ncbi:MAG: energy-coupling factor transporter transmembrane component T [Candidatus Marinimicrobia bacterium]|nr:energy-coupling factor transporter transmembrane component T [Candidatus Neomarinimicrobiota bacterium]